MFGSSVSRLRFLGLAVGLGVAACAASGSLDGYDDAEAAGAEGGSTFTDASIDGATGATGPTVVDSGPPAMIGNDGGPSGADSSTPSGGCMSLADCPYGTATNVEAVACVDGGCVITCNGENYDVNGTLADGCEVAAICPSSQGAQICPIDDHTSQKAASIGSFSCVDSASQQNITGTIPSDAREHVPAIDGFDPVTGSAPNYFTIHGTGGVCVDDANLSLQMAAPTAQLPCYVLHLLTDKNNGQTCQTDSTGHCDITNTSASYSDNSDLSVWITKAPSCTAAGFPDDGKFAITGHL